MTIGANAPDGDTWFLPIFKNQIQELSWTIRAIYKETTLSQNGMSIFKDFQGLENQKLKLKDFQRPARTLVILSRYQKFPLRLSTVKK